MKDNIKYNIFINGSVVQQMQESILRRIITETIDKFIKENLF